MRHTKIVATLGPASLNRDTLAAMIRAGMDVARLNTGHGTMEEHMRSTALVREVAAEAGKPVAVLLDLGGPKLRTGPTDGARPLDLTAGATVTLTPRLVKGSSALLTVDYPRLTDDVAPGDQVLLDDGRIELQVQRLASDGLECRVVVGGLLGPNKGVNFPHSNLTAPALTDRDREAVRAGVECGVDFLALSFVSQPSDVAEARDLVASHGADTPIIAKIERRRAAENLDAIIAEADGAMVARGDLGVEMAPEEVPLQQRRIIASCAAEMIPVITATQMLESMVDSPRPTRAEASDVANAVWDMSDALMLSGETAVGRYPVEAVAMMDRIIRRAESVTPPDRAPLARPETDDHSHVVAIAARRIVESDPNMRAVVCHTRSGYTAFLMSKVHPEAPIFAITPGEAVCRRLSLARSVAPLLGPRVANSEELLRAVDSLLLGGGHVGWGEEVVVVASHPVTSGSTNFLKLHRVGEGANA
ncbi:MAG: pyruvate kinase [Dehalococcoidia bacterium]|nr:MAG: pyruvate kinase [bacterium]MCK6563787.1 pyruvate kinase [Dehalococcoidia bacterium]MCL4231419.1 pyruvate kinase [Dehalococcoidia bacterium]NUQ54869.1 pyruvate kinase [Dehalococcoidia bacterium]RIL03760.1 MAG: pyruvate kinase [bacterium]